MKKQILGLIVLAGALAVPALAGADTAPVAAVKADLAKLQADVQAKHDTIIAHAHKLATDAAAAKSAPTRKDARAAIQPDVQKLRDDLVAARTVLQADRAQLATDLATAKQDKANRKELRPVVQSTRQAIKQLRTELRAELKLARAAVRDLRASFKK
jgi:hypothetical protein